MKLLSIFLLIGTVASGLAAENRVNPLAKVYQLLGDLKSHIIDNGEVEAKAYKEYAQWCRHTSASVANEIKMSTASKEKLTAQIAELSSNMEVGSSKVDNLSGVISKTEADLKSANAIREEEASEFAQGESELIDAVDTLARAISMLERQASKGGSFAQINTLNLQTLLQSVSTITDAAGLTGSSQEKLLALVQAQGETEASDDDMGAPKAAAYQSQNGGIMQLMDDMKDKAEGQLAELRKTEASARNSHALLKHGLEDELAATTKEVNDDKQDMAEGAEDKASAQGNLEVTTKENEASKAKLARIQGNCQVVATDEEANVAARAAELKTIDEAVDTLKASTGGAEKWEMQYSFLQTSAESKSTQKAKAMLLARSAVVAMVQQLAKQQHSSALAQLASRISAQLKYGQHGSVDPFEKVKGLINTMIAKLENQANAEATEKAYCDKEMSKTAAKKTELDDTIEKLSTKIEKMASKSGGLKEEVAELNSELADIAKETVEMDKMRREESAAYASSRKELEHGLAGVRKALTLLREFYAAPEESALLQTGGSDDDDQEQMSSLMQQASRQPAAPQKAEKSTGAGGGIINLLEVVESDFAKNLATEDAAESDAQTAYEKQTQANKIATAQQGQDVKFKTQEFTALDKSISESASDKATEVQEVNAVTEYFGTLKARCIAKPSTYEERKNRREAEIKGLSEALSSLESAALMELGSRSRRTTSRSLRGEGKLQAA